VATVRGRTTTSGTSPPYPQVLRKRQRGLRHIPRAGRWRSPAAHTHHFALYALFTEDGSGVVVSLHRAHAPLCITYTSPPTAPQPSRLRWTCPLSHRVVSLIAMATCAGGRLRCWRTAFPRNIALATSRPPPYPLPNMVAPRRLGMAAPPPLLLLAPASSPVYLAGRARWRPNERLGGGCHCAAWSGRAAMLLRRAA